MKGTGIVRLIDSLGRIVIPIEMRRSLGVNADDPIEISLQGDTIILRKVETSCVFCGGSENIVKVKDRPVCKGCIEDMKSNL